MSWSQHVTSNVLCLEEGVFTWKSARKIAKKPENISR
jgi:hypothetical protein